MIEYPLAELPTPDENGEFTLKLANGGHVPKIDPVTRQPTGEAQRFVVADDGGVVPITRVPDPKQDVMRSRRTALPPTAALSSRERSARMDEAIAVVNANAKALDELRRKVELHAVEISELRQSQLATRLALAQFECRDWRARLRWLLGRG